MLLLQDVVEVVERGRPARRAVDRAQHFSQVVVQLLLFHQPLQPPPQGVALLFAALGLGGAVVRRPGRQLAKALGQLLQLLRHLRAGIAKPGQPLQHSGVGQRPQRKAQVAVADAKRAVLVLQPDAAAFQHAAVEIAEHRHQDPFLQRGLARIPVNIEIGRVARAVAMLQHIEPAPVERPLDAHMIRDKIGQQAHAPLAQLRAHLSQALDSPQLRVHLILVADIVAMRAAGRRAENGRGIDVRDAELMQVGNQRRQVVEGEARIELHAVGRVRDAKGRLHLAFRLAQMRPGRLPERGFRYSGRGAGPARRPVKDVGDRLGK